MSVQSETQYVNIPNGTSINHPLNLLSENYVLYASNIGVQYVFEQEINLELFKKALYSLLIEFPALSGVANFKSWSIVPSEKGVPIEIVHHYPGKSSDHGTVGVIQRNSADFVNEPARSLVEKGKGNLFAIKITNFEDGGSILGITVNHALGDATGHHLIAHRFSAHFKSVLLNQPVEGDLLIPLLPDIFNFGTERTVKETLADLKKYNLSKPLKVKGFPGFLFKKLIAGALNKAKRSDRELIYFSADHLAKLKEKVREESGLDWISTNIAVVAHTNSVMSDLFFGKKAATVTQVSNLFNMRNRYFQPEDERQKRYCGNAMYIHVPRAYFENGFQKATRGEIAQFLKVEFDKVSEESVRRQMDLVIDCLRHGYTYPNLDAMKPLIGSNNQSKLDVYGVDFGAGELLRVIPQDIGEGILLFPGKDGGMEIYLRHSLKPKLTSQLRNKEWQKKLYAI